eukprot:scaffold34343_cov74-Phaeocystis_antarctica.AAC.3
MTGLLVEKARRAVPTRACAGPAARIAHASRAQVWVTMITYNAVYCTPSHRGISAHGLQR